MSHEWKLEDKWLYVPIVGFLIILLFELLRYSSLYSHYPFHNATDLNTYILGLKLLAQYGYHALVPNINQGIILFGSYPIGWAYFNLPFYYLTGDVLKANFLSLLTIFGLFLVTFYYLGKSQKLSIAKILCFYVMFLANPLVVDELFRIGRSSEMLGWLAFALFFTFLIFYKDRQIGIKFYVLFTAAYTLTLCAHIYHFLLASLFVAGFFFIRTNKERMYIFLCSALTILITSSWWLTFSEYAKIRPHNWGIASEFLSSGLFSRHIAFSYSTLTSLILLITAYLYFSSRTWSRKDILYFLPALALPILILTKLIVYIPVLNSIPANMFSVFSIFLSLFFFFSTIHFKTTKMVKAIIIAFLLLSSFVFGVFIFIHIHNSTFETRNVYTQTDKDVMTLIPDIKDPFIALGDGPKPTRLDWGYTYYAIIYSNKTTIIDGYCFLVVNMSLENNAIKLISAYESKDCAQIKPFVKEGRYSTILSYNEHCAFWESCGFKAYARNENACLIDAKSI